MEPWQVASLLLALHNIAKATGDVAFYAGMIAILAAARMAFRDK